MWLAPLLAVLIALLGLTIVLSDFQTRAIFPTDAVAAPGPLPQGAELMRLATAESDTLHGVYVPPTAASEQRKLILGFGGNAWNAVHVATYLHDLYPEQHVVAFHYRGYKPSTGVPSAAALIADAPLVYDAAVARVQPDQTFAVGFSIGSGIAASLANRRPLDGIILVTPFDSLKSVAQSIFPWLPVGPFFAHEIDTVAFLKGSRVPVAILAAQRDEIIPPRRTAALRSHVVRLAFDRTLPRAGHNDIYQRPDFRSAMREALASVIDAARERQ